MDRPTAAEMLARVADWLETTRAIDGTPEKGSAASFARHRVANVDAAHVRSLAAVLSVSTEPTGRRVTDAVWRACEAIESKAQESEGAEQAAYREAIGIFWDEMAALKP